MAVDKKRQKMFRDFPFLKKLIEKKEVRTITIKRMSESFLHSRPEYRHFEGNFSVGETAEVFVVYENGLMSRLKIKTHKIRKTRETDESEMGESMIEALSKYEKDAINNIKYMALLKTEWNDEDIHSSVRIYKKPKHNYGSTIDLVQKWKNRREQEMMAIQ